MLGKTMKELKIGESASFQKTISESDVYLFAGISGDINPAHINEEYMRDSRFKGRIAHGLLTASMISAVLGTKLPGPGTIYLGQELKFLAPVMIGDTVKATAEVIDLIPETNRVILSTVCTNQLGRTVISGQATVLAPILNSEAM